MGLLSFKKRGEAEGAKYLVLRRFQWNGGIAAVGDVITVDDPDTARELVGTKKAEPLGAAAVEFLKMPSRWIEQPRTTSISPRGGNAVFSRQSPWSPIE